MKKIICLLLTTLFIFSFSGCDDLDHREIETEPPCATGHSFTYEYTNTCDKDGYKISTCSVCGFEEKEAEKAKGHSYGNWEITVHGNCERNSEIVKTCSCGHAIKQIIKAVGHDFIKNNCQNCNYNATEISQLPLKYRQKISEEIKTIAPFYSDLETLNYLSDLFFLTVRDIEVNEIQLQEAINKYNSVPLVRVYQNGYWVWVQHQPSLIAAQKEVEAAKKAKAQNEEILLSLRDSIEVNAQGAAWEVLIEELGSQDTSNKIIASRLAAVLLEYSSTTGNSNPSWKQDIFDTFKEKTGLEIDMSQALS